MSKHARSESTQSDAGPSSLKKQRTISPVSFSPNKVASTENATAADANPPLLQVSEALKDVLKSPQKGECIVFWMRMADLRIKDNRGLSQASKQAQQEGLPLVVLFVVSPQDYIAHDRGARKIDFTLRNLASVQADLDKLNIPLHTVTVSKRKTVPSEVLSLLASLGCNRLYANLEYEVDELRRDLQLCNLAKKEGKQINFFHNKCIVEPNVIRTKEGKAYAVYSPYARQWLKVLNDNIAYYLEEAPAPVANPPTVRDNPKLGPLFKSTVPAFVEGYKLEEDDAAVMKEMWPEGEDKAAKILLRFLTTKARSSQIQAVSPLSDGAAGDPKFNRITKYHNDRDRADKDTTSRLSPYLSSGVISIREVVRTVLQASGSKKVDTNGNTGVGKYIGELAWRDFYTDILCSFPRVSMGRPYLEKFSEIIWENHQAPADNKLGRPGSDYADGEALKRWKDGMTGVPIVDAAMRCIRKTGWCHNRLRMIVAMFLTKHLMIDWRVGERYFMETLIDGDLASNNGGWQWSASTGVDPCPYFRIFNPYSQSLKADPGGDFIRQWVPELKAVRGPELHNPPASLAKKVNYPLPIVEHKEARERALRRFKNPGSE
ncbi:DNA photolyase, FAD-binding/Cryptochrome [Coprinopsis sp. MPI-PUGE-AT-0042]|nr:DNA photolyase, FAD-binding/Cryptochrome [Coprinopsis sp. MPI-PUGE-AT-0042]